MKTLKIGMFAAALLLIFAGCNNAVAPTPTAKVNLLKMRMSMEQVAVMTLKLRNPALLKQLKLPLAI